MGEWGVGAYTAKNIIGYDMNVQAARKVYDQAGAAGGDAERQVGEDGGVVGPGEAQAGADDQRIGHG
ncbi:hypothetical protein [Nocardia cyriacigeorgica]|uniref:hypothetical protein n=1 Tax=Nocardia cyriacigeorgica TaxID=135487 RepID=UPI0024575241|nr:hypothetical protein [Nocardia cyriacigeorgica]